MQYIRMYISIMIILGTQIVAGTAYAEPVNFVMQLTRSADNFGHRKVMFQIDKVLDDLGEKAVKITVVAYEDGIHALLAKNEQTNQYVTKLANRGVVFKACKVSMRANDLKEDDFPLEVDYVPVGAPEVIRLQMQGYKYWRP